MSTERLQGRNPVIEALQRRRRAVRLIRLDEGAQPDPKLDRLLTAEITPECPHPDWLRSLAGLLQASELTVVAEGIETDTQLQALRAAGVQWGQGYHFSPPLAVAEFIAWHEKWEKTSSCLATNRFAAKPV